VSCGYVGGDLPELGQDGGSIRLHGAEAPDMSIETETTHELDRDDPYFDEGPRRRLSFDARLLQEPLTLLPSRPPLTLSRTDSVKEAMHAMRKRHRGCVLITADGSLRSPLVGIFTERDVLLKIIDSGRNPADVPLSDVMTDHPESLPIDAKLAWALNMMSVGGFRHLPVTDDRGWPAFILSVRDIVEFLVESFPAEILNLPPDFRREKGLPRDGA
jgi:CBS domain-containing protein